MSVTQATKAKVKNIAAIVTCAALVLILFGAALAQWAHTSGGKVQIKEWFSWMSRRLVCSG